MISGLTHVHVMTYTINGYLDLIGGETKQQTIAYTLLHVHVQKHLQNVQNNKHCCNSVHNDVKVE